MKIGLIDVDGHGWPNIALMKLSSWHKAAGDTVEWYDPFFSYDRVYLSKVFSFSPDYDWYINAKEVIRGGTGYAIVTENGKEHFCSSRHSVLTDEVEHVYPDYSLYPEETKDRAYGFLTRGCPRGCFFCHVAQKEGEKSKKVADLSEFWNGQKEIVLLDPNILACAEWENLLTQLRDSGAWVEFSQGLDARLLTEEKVELIRSIRTKRIHFAWDRYEDGGIIVPKLRRFKEITGWDSRRMSVYMLTNYDTTLEQDLERVYKLRELGFSPYVMVYNKSQTKSSDPVRKLQRWVNSPFIFNTVERFEDYKQEKRGKI